MEWTHRPGSPPASLPTWQLAVESAPPLSTHPAQLATELKALTGDKPSVLTDGGGKLVALRFHADPSDRAAVEAAVSAHDGSAALLADETARQSDELARKAQREDLEAMRAKRTDKGRTPAQRRLSPEEHALAVNVLIDRMLGVSPADSGDWG